MEQLKEHAGRREEALSAWNKGTVHTYLALMAFPWLDHLLGDNHYSISVCVETMLMNMNTSTQIWECLEHRFERVGDSIFWKNSGLKLNP